jgi:general L-amino acid transport system substrate-binding protein
MVLAIKAGGNYGEILSAMSARRGPLETDRGLNAAWSKGGLMYAIPFK